MVTIGIIGAGRIGHVHAQSITYSVPNARIKAIADPFMDDKTAAWAKSLGIANTTKDYKEIIKDPEIDAVLICSSTNTHAPISIEAIKAGKHVFCEKPIDLELSKIQEVADTLKNSNVKYQVGFNRRFDHNFKALREAVHDGKIGKVQICKVTSRDPEPPSPAYVAVSGGLFLDMTIHDFDMVSYLCDSGIEEVYVEAACTVDPAIGKAGDVDTAIILLKMGNGSLAVIDNCRKSVYGYDQRAEVFGTKGMIANANDSDSNAVLSTVDGVIGEKPQWFFLQRYMNSYTEEMQQFIQCIEKDLPTPTTLKDGYKAVAAGLAAKKSAAEHRPVKVSEIG